MCGEKYRGHVHMCKNWPPTVNHDAARFSQSLDDTILGIYVVLLVTAIVLGLTSCTTSNMAIRGTELPKVRKAADGHYGWHHTQHFHNYNH
jgi:hypothetical protein